MNNKIMFGMGGLIIGVVLVSVLSPATGYRSMMFGNQTRSIGNTNQINKHFIEQMIPHHEGAMVMAQLAFSKAVHPEIKTLAGAIIEAQNKEIADMRSWHKDWFNKDVFRAGVSMMGGGMMSGGGMHMGGQEDVQTLINAADFDKAFIEAMIPHHQLAVMMAQMLKSGTSRPEMLTLANNIIESQSKEITEMQGWYKSWYK